MSGISDDKALSLLAEVIAGERPRTDPDVLALLEARPEFEERLTSLSTLGSELSAIGRTERADLRAALDQPASGEDAVSDAVRRELAPPASGHRGWLVPTLALAAVLIVGAVFWWPSNGAAGDPARDTSGQHYYLGEGKALPGAMPQTGDVVRLGEALVLDLGPSVQRSRGRSLELELYDLDSGQQLWARTLDYDLKWTLQPDELAAILEGSSDRIAARFSWVGGELLHVATLNVAR